MNQEENRRAYGHEELLVLLPYHPLMITRITFLDWEDTNRYGGGELRAEFDVAGKYIRAMSKLVLLAACEQGLSFYLRRNLSIGDAQTYLACAGGVTANGVAISDDVSFVEIVLKIGHLNVYDRHAIAHAHGRVGFGPKPLIEVKDLQIGIDI